MNRTITGKFFAVREEDYQGTMDYLRLLGLPSASNEVDSLLFHVEIRETPKILLKLEQKDYVKAANEWHILRISSEGIVFYVASPHGDGYIFVPRENIVSVHTIDQKFLDTLHD